MSLRRVSTLNCLIITLICNKTPKMCLKFEDNNKKTRKARYDMCLHIWPSWSTDRLKTSCNRRRGEQMMYSGPDCRQIWCHQKAVLSAGVMPTIALLQLRFLCYQLDDLTPTDTYIITRSHSTFTKLVKNSLLNVCLTCKKDGIRVNEVFSCVAVRTAEPHIHVILLSHLHTDAGTVADDPWRSINQSIRALV